MNFKTWLLLSEIGGQGSSGVADPAPSAEMLAKLSAKHGVGAFPTYAIDEEPPKTGSSPLKGYIAKMRKRMKKH